MLAREGAEDLRQIMDECLCGAVEQIAIMHGGKSQDWIDRKTEAVVSIMEAMVEVSSQDVSFSSAVSISEDDLARFERETTAAMIERDHEFMAAFATRLPELLRP